MNETSAALAHLDPALAYLDPALAYPPLVVPAAPPIDADVAGLPELPDGHPQWQRDVVSMSARARAVIAQAIPVVVRTLNYWDHRIREVAFGTRSLAVDPAGCYRLR